jgi:tetraacyldisaccharide 4'-kinase
MLSRLYRAVLQKRVSLYESGVLKSFSLGALTVSVGNLTVGGTGKTPLVAFVAEILAQKGKKVCIISRGYKRENPKQKVLVSDGEKILADAKQAGDEPFELAQKLLGKAVVVADANRVLAGNWARGKFRITAFVLDDAFQHLRAERDLDIVMIDATNPFGNRKLLPFGILREPLLNLKRADAIVITRANLVETVEHLKAEIRIFNSNCPIFVSENKISKIIRLEEFFAKAQKETNYGKGEIQNTNNLKPGFLAFCGLGNPSNFFEQLRHENFDLIATETFPDHYFYKQTDTAKLEKKARQNGAKILLTTAKDAVKLKDLKFVLPCFVVESRMVFDNETNFRSWLNTKIEEIERK